MKRRKMEKPLSTISWGLIHLGLTIEAINLPLAILLGKLNYKPITCLDVFFILLALGLILPLSGVLLLPKYNFMKNGKEEEDE